MKRQIISVLLSLLVTVTLGLLLDRLDFHGYYAGYWVGSLGMASYHISLIILKK